MIDTHTHLYLSQFDADRADVMKRAFDAGVSHMVFPNVDLTTIAPMRQLAAQYPQSVSMAMGFHPTEVKEDWRDCVAQCMDELGDGSGYVAVGEVGIDLYWDKTFESEQMQAFDQQVARAVELDLPVIIHCREGLEQTLEVMQGHPHARAVFHSFSGSATDVDRIRRVGDYYFGVNGVVTFKNCHVRDSIHEITLDRLVLETDAPYLAPVPNRGKRNESSYLAHTASHIASHLNIPLSEIDARTTASALHLFPLILG